MGIQRGGSPQGKLGRDPVYTQGVVERVALGVALGVQEKGVQENTS